MLSLVFLDLIDDVDGTIITVGAWLGDESLLFEVAQSDKFAAAADDGVAVEEVTRFCMKFSIDYFVVGNSVTLHDDVANAGLFAFDNADIDIDRVPFDSHLDRSYIEEEVTVVHIHGSDVGAAGIVGEVGFECCFVVGVAFVDAKVFGEELGWIDGVAREGDVAEIEGLALVYFHFDLYAVLFFLLVGRDVEVLAGHRPHGVHNDAGVAIAKLVVIGDDLLQVVMELEFAVFRAAPEAFGPHEKLLEIVDIVGVFHFAEQLIGGHLIVALENERVDLDTLTLFDVESEHHIVVASRSVGAEASVDLDIGKAFVGIVGSSLVGTRFQHVLSNHIADMDAEVFAQFVGIVAADAIETDSSELGAAAEDNFQEDLVVLNSGKKNLYILKKALLPEIIDGCGYFVARDFDDIADLEACDKQNHALVQRVIIVDSDTSYFVGLRSEIVNIIISTERYLRFGVEATCQEDEKSQ